MLEICPPIVVDFYLNQDPRKTLVTNATPVDKVQLRTMAAILKPIDESELFYFSRKIEIE